MIERAEEAWLRSRELGVNKKEACVVRIRLLLRTEMIEQIANINERNKKTYKVQTCMILRKKCSEQ